MRLHATVRLKYDVPEHNLRAGTVGVIVAVLSTSEEAYEVEFADRNGETTVELALKPGLIELVEG